LDCPQSTFEANFYVEREDTGKPLAACVVRSLSEMNTDPTGAARPLAKLPRSCADDARSLSGTAVQASPVEFVREAIRDKSKLQGFTIVQPLPPPSLPSHPLPSITVPPPPKS
jgi:hypothetical protein